MINGRAPRTRRLALGATVNALNEMITASGPFACAMVAVPGSAPPSHQLVKVGSPLAPVSMTVSPQSSVTGLSGGVGMRLSVKLLGRYGNRTMHAPAPLHASFNVHRLRSSPPPPASSKGNSHWPEVPLQVPLFLRHRSVGTLQFFGSPPLHIIALSQCAPTRHGSGDRHSRLAQSVSAQ